MTGITSHRRHSSAVSLTGVVFAALLMVVLVIRNAEACMCMDTYSGQPACQSRWQYTEIFVGRVASIVPAPSKSKLVAMPVTIRFAVTESFLGVSTPIYELGDDLGSSCSFNFETGKQYLVYANHGTVIVCSPTKTLEQAAEDLKYLRAVPATRPRDGRIIGIAIHDESSLDPPDRKPTPFVGMLIVAEGEGLRRTATTGRDGKYEIRVPVGKFHVHAEPPAGMYTMFEEDVTLRDTRGCAVADFDVRFDGHINGRVVTSDGAPVPHLTIELTPTAPDDADAVVIDRTDENGRIRLEHVPPGTFVLGFQTGHMSGRSADSPAIYLPGTVSRADARLIKIQPSGTVEVGSLVIPASQRFVTLSGVVRDETGAPLKHACAWLTTDTAERDLMSDCVATAADGTFAIAVPEGRRYVVSVDWHESANRYASAGVKGVIATADMKPLVIVAIRK